MATFYENAGICCLPPRLRSVLFWLDYNLPAAASTAASPTTSTGRATTAATSAINHAVVRADHINPTGLSDCSSHSGGHLGQPDGAHCSCPHGECQHFQRAQTEKKVHTSGTSSASVSQPQSPQASSWPPCQRWSRVSPSRLHSKASTGSQGHAGVPAIWYFV